jgi:hypothetical protein
MITVGYKIPGSNRGGCFTVPDTYWKKFNEDDASLIAERLRVELGREPPWQTVRGKLIRLAKSKGAV